MSTVTGDGQFVSFPLWPVTNLSPIERRIHVGGLGHTALRFAGQDRPQCNLVLKGTPL